MPFMARFKEKRPKDNDSLVGKYSEEKDLWVISRNGKEKPLIFTEMVCPETKTITCVKRERED